MSVLKRQVSSSAIFVSFFIVMTYNSSANFKLIHLLLWTKESHQSPNFDTFKCSGENLPNTLCHFWNHKSVFLQILHHSCVSWKITPLYLFGSNHIYFTQLSTLKWKLFMPSSAQVKIHQTSHVNFETASQFLFKFCIILHCHDA